MSYYQLLIAITINDILITKLYLCLSGGLVVNGVYYVCFGSLVVVAVVISKYDSYNHLFKSLYWTCYVNMGFNIPSTLEEKHLYGVI